MFDLTGVVLTDDLVEVLGRANRAFADRSAILAASSSVTKGEKMNVTARHPLTITTVPALPGYALLDRALAHRASEVTWQSVVAWVVSVECDKYGCPVYRCADPVTFNSHSPNGFILRGPNDECWVDDWGPGTLVEALDFIGRSAKNARKKGALMDFAARAGTEVGFKDWTDHFAAKGMSSRAANCLADMAMRAEWSDDELVFTLSDFDLFRVPGLGRKSYEEIRKAYPKRAASNARE